MNPSQLIENRSVRTIFRDCLKLAKHMVEDPARVEATRLLLRHEFEKNKYEMDQEQIRNMKLLAVKGISNYIIHTVKDQYKIPRPSRNILDEAQQHEEYREDKL